MHASVTLQSTADSWFFALHITSSWPGDVFGVSYHGDLTWNPDCQLSTAPLMLTSAIAGYQPSYQHAHTTETNKWCMHQRGTIRFPNATLWKWWTPKVVVMFKNHNSVWSCSGQPPHTVKGQEKKKGASGEESVLKGESLQQCQTRHRLLRARLESRWKSRTSSVVFVFLQDVFGVWPLHGLRSVRPERSWFTKVC